MANLTIDFVKMHGAGNDYVYINCMGKENGDYSGVEEKYFSKIAEILSDRNFGIGGDGVVFICKSDKADATMRMFNLDGSEGKMCGNAIRCVAKFLYDNKISTSNPMEIDTLSGVKILDLTVENEKVTLAKVDMGAAILQGEKIPTTIKSDTVVDVPLTILDKEYKVTCVSMGNPHCVVFGQDPDLIHLEKIGPIFESHEIFPEKVNTEFIQVIDKNTLKMRVWERGSGETLACGTGACGAVVAAVLNGHCDKNSDVTVKLRGGDLIIRYTDETVFMTGGCTTVFKGQVEIEV